MKSKLLQLLFVPILFFAQSNIALSSNLEDASPSEAMLLLEPTDQLQKRTVDVTGIITDQDGEPLIGVTILVKGTNKGTVTNLDGQYTLEDIGENAILVLSYIGYETQEISVEGRGIIDVVMTSDVQLLDELVVVGFGEQKRESMVASITSVKGEQLRAPTRSLSTSLAGQFSGLIAVQRSGEPGYDNAEFWIRGMSSFAGGTNPLILVDGVPRQMNDIEPDEIETFTLLKDAAATSVYGSEGANGVVLITSKRGREQKTSISYRGEVSRLEPTRLPEYVNSWEYLSYWNEALRYDGEPELYPSELIEKYSSQEDLDLYPNTDWVGLLVKDYTTSTRHTLNFRGGGDRMKFFVSGAYFSEDGLFAVHDKYNNNANINRYNLRSNVDINVTKTTLLRVDLSGQYLQANRPRTSTSSIFQWMAQTPNHFFPHKYSDGTIAGPVSGGLGENPYNHLVERGYSRQWRSGIQSKVFIEQKLDMITKGLKVRGAVSFDSNSFYNMTRDKSPETFLADGRDDEGNLIFTQTRNASSFGSPTTSSSGNKNIYLEAALNYSRTFDDRHAVTGMALYNQKDRQLDNNALAYRKQAMIGRATYSYDNRYVIEGNFSYTGSEQFADGYRFGFFPAVGVAWNVMNEHFMPENLKNTIYALKLRASVGRTGNDQTGSARFLYRPTFSSGSNYYWGIESGGVTNGVGSSLKEGRFASPTLSWEIEMKRNYGIDLSLFSGKIDISADYFDNERSSILLQRKTVSGVAGFQEFPWQNFGVVTNKGVDGSLNIRHRIGEVDLSLRGNFTFARNKIIEYDEVPQQYPWMNVTGTRLNAMIGKVAERLFTDDDFNITVDDSGNKLYTLREGIAYYNKHPNPKPGDIKYVDQNGDGVVDDNFDSVKDLGHPTIPEIMYGFGLNAAYKGFYGSVFFQGAGNVSLNIMNLRTFAPFFESLTNVRREIYDSRWTEENPSQNVLYPRISIHNTSNTLTTENTWFHRDASFLRLKNVEVGYNLSKEMASKIMMSGARIYIMGQNVALWDKVKIQDPEQGSTGGGIGYPLTSVWSVGLEISF